METSSPENFHYGSWKLWAQREENGTHGTEHLFWDSWMKEAHLVDMWRSFITNSKYQLFNKLLCFALLQSNCDNFWFWWFCYGCCEIGRKAHKNGYNWSKYLLWFCYHFGDRWSDNVQIQLVYIFNLMQTLTALLPLLNVKHAPIQKYVSLINFTKYPLVKRNKFFCVLRNECVFDSQYIAFKGLAIHNSLWLFLVDNRHFLRGFVTQKTLKFSL